MSLTSDEQDRFLASLRTDAAFRDAVRRQLLSEELLRLPERFSAFVEETHAFVEEMHTFVEATGRRLGSLEQATDRLTDDSAKLRGMVLEQKIRMNPGYYLGRHARRVRVLGIDGLLDEVGLDDLADDEYALLARTDVLARGTSRAHGGPVVLVVEATWGPHRGDIERQVARRQFLADRQIDALAIIASTEPLAEAVRQEAEDRGIILELEAAAAA